MLGYLVSLLMGLAVGASYGLVQVCSPAPPLMLSSASSVCWQVSKRSTWPSAISRHPFRPPSKNEVGGAQGSC
jgi:hypothetical protein